MLVPEKNPKIMDFAAAERATRCWQAEGKRVAFTNGCFDLLHIGHVHLLREAKRLASVLVVALNSDRSVRALKGNTRPISGEQDRAEVLAAIEYVDCVVLFDQDTPADLIELVRPDVLVKGANYKVDEIAGADFVRSQGGEVVLVPLVEGKSTSHLVREVAQQQQARP